MAGHAHLQDLWWPPFEDLYAALQEYKSARSPTESRHVEQLLSSSSNWLRLGLGGFRSPAPEALSLLQQGGHLKLRHGSALPIKTEHRAAALSFSQLMVREFMRVEVCLGSLVAATRLLLTMCCAGPQ